MLESARDDDCHDIKVVLAYDSLRFNYVYRALDPQSCSQAEGAFCAVAALVPIIGHPPRQTGKLWIDSLRIELEEIVEISARNTLQGKVKRVAHGAVNTEITVALPGGAELVSIITKVSADRLGLAEGKAVYVVIKASDVMIATE